MTPIKFTIRGAIGILAGLGRDELSIDLASSLPDDAVTVAIRGDNGTGKSTLLNLALTPWLNPPQIAGNIYDHFGATGLRELEWNHGTERYRSRIEYKQSTKTKTTRAYLHRLVSGSWEPVIGADNTVSDGKTRTYEACLTSILGPQSVYYLSAFRAQNAPRLADYDDPKGLMRDLLHLDEPQLLAQSARDVARELRREYENIKDKADEVAAKEEAIACLSEDLTQLDMRWPALTAARSEATETHAFAKAELDRAMQESLDHERINAQRRDLQARIVAVNSRTSNDAARLSGAIKDCDKDIRDLSLYEARERANIESQIKAAEHRIREAQDVMERKRDIDYAVRDIPVVEKSLSTANDECARINNVVAEKNKLQAALDRMKDKGKHLIEQGMTLKLQRDDLHKRAGFVTIVPCLGKSKYAECPALKDAIAAGKQLPVVQSQLEAKSQDFEAHSSIVDDLVKQIAGFGDPESELRGVEKEVSALQTRLRDLSGVAALAPQLARAEDTIQLETQAIDNEHRRLAVLSADAQSRRDELHTRHLSLDAELARVIAASESEIAALQEQIAALPETDTSAIEHARAALQAADTALAEATSAWEANRAAVADALARQESLQRDVDAGASIMERAKHLEDEIGTWTLLGLALRGVIDLSIEDAGPGIAAIANRLLSEAYGPRFTLRIVTQREQQNGRLVECFDISVIDAESGVESSIVHKSGGETVWLDKALSDAVGIYHQDAADIHFEALFADEAEDGLTQERKHQFYRMDRAALELGGYRRKYFVSHNPDAWSLADAVIDMAEHSQIIV